MVLHSFVPFPAEFVALANGMLYGPVWGTLITWIGAMLGAFLAFGLSRAFGRPFVATVVARRRWHRPDPCPREHDAQLVLLATFLLVISFSLVIYTVGVSLAYGMLYGPVWVTIITWIGAMLGAFLAFGLSRAFGRPFVETVVARRHWQRLDDWTGEHAAQMVFLARFLPVISFNLVNYAAGLTRISWWTFGWTTGLGILPMTILMAAMGDQAGRMPWHWWLALLAAAVLGWIFIQGWLHRRNAKRAITMQSKVSSHHGEHGSTPAARGKREGVPPQPPQ